MDYNELDSKYGYTLVEYRGEYYVLDKNDDVVANLVNDGEDWKQFIENHVDTTSNDNSKEQQHSVYYPKSTTIKNLKTKYSDYNGFGYILTNNKGSLYYSDDGKNHCINPTENSVVVFLDYNSAKQKIKYTDLDNIVRVRINNGKVIF